MADFFHNALSFIVAIGVLVAFHEFGHFWVARRLGVKVLRYSIGFGPVLLSRRGADGCEYALSAVPLGGYVKMLDEREGEVPAAELPRAFNRQSPYKRFAIVAAGPLANFLLAIVLFWGMYVIGQPGLKTLVAAPKPGSVAAAAGVVEGEQVLSVNGHNTPTWASLRTAVLEQAVNRTPMLLRLRSDAGERTLTLPMQQVRMEPEYLFDDLGLAPKPLHIEPVIADVLPGSAAAQAGFIAGDRLLRYNDIAIDSWQDWALWVRAHPGAVVEIDYQRAGVTRQAKVLLATETENGNSIGRFGTKVNVVAGEAEAVDRLAPMPAIPAAIGQTWRMATLTLKMFGRMFTGEVSFKNISGPLQTAEAAGFAASIGFTTFLSLLALISVSIGVINLLPVPVLDGGHLLFNLVEIVKGSPLPDRVMVAGQRIGLSLIMLLMGLAFYNDLSRYFG
jgi:regulator of sigma E protease